MNDTVSTLQAIIRRELETLRIAELGIVTAVHPHADSGDSDNYSCDVRLKNTGLELPRVPVATGHIGTVAIPNVGDLVLLAFDRGDINQPIITGRLYNDEDRPPINTSDEVIFRLPLAEADDQTIKAAIRNHQTDNPPRELIIEMDPKITIRVTDGTVRATAGPSELFIDQTGASGGTVTVVTGGTKITLNQDGDATVEAIGALNLKAQQDVTIEGLNVKIKGQINTEVEAGVQASLKGTITQVEGSGPTTLKGGIVNIQGVTNFSP
ncbi:phage baseplate assembly protein V [Shimia sp.]|uniref:phage baseplate assembly protein V n=1 Tax=Shimia sp. TaxID=1954381 RepID=UPI003BAAF525